MDCDGTRTSNLDSLKFIDVEFFKHLYSKEGHCISMTTTSTFPQAVTNSCSSLTQVPSEEEVKAVLFDMDGLKAPRPDGFVALYYQNQWETIKTSIVNFISESFQGSILLSFVNETLLTLLPKVPNLESILQFRPIGLCNVNYKVFSKLLLKCIL